MYGIVTVRQFGYVFVVLGTVLNPPIDQLGFFIKLHRVTHSEIPRRSAPVVNATSSWTTTTFILVLDEST
jgi:hypothetical protein